MSENFYSPTPRLRTRLLTLATALLLAPAAMAQVVVPAGNPNTSSARRPLGTWFGYERSAIIYAPAEIGSSGTITSIGFYVNSVSTPGDAPTKVYIKTVSSSTFAAATTVAAEETGATLVYDATIPAASFTANNWVTIPLTTSFAYNGTSNLEVIVETNATGGGNETSTGKQFRSNNGQTNQAQYWSQDTTVPTGTGTLSAVRPNIQLTGITASACPAATAVTISAITPTSAQVAFTPGTGNTSYTISYYPTATPANVTTVTPAPTASPVTLSNLTAGTAYTVTVVGNCASGAGTQASIASFTTTVPVPANDNPTGAIDLPIAATCTPLNGTNAGATTTTASGYANPGLAGCGIASSPKDVWYKFTTTAAGVGSTSVRLTVTGAPAGYIRLFSAASSAGPFTELACAAGTTNNTVSAPLTYYTLTPGTTYYVSVAGYGSADTQGAFTICATSLLANEAAVAAVYTVGKVSPLASPVAVQAVIRNLGGSAITNRTVTLNVTGATTFTNTQTIASLAAGATTTVTFTAYPVTATTGVNTVTVVLGTDDDATNNTGVYSQTVSTTQLSYSDDTQALNATGVGVSNTTPGGALATKFTVSQAARVSEVRLNFPASAGTTSTYQVVVFDATGTGGLPGTALFTSATQSRPATAGVVTVPVSGTVAVNGTFYVGLREISGNVSIGYQVEDPLRSGTFLFQTSATGAWTDVNTTTLKTRLAIEVGLSSVSSTRNAELANAIGLFPNPAQESFTVSLPALAGQQTAQLTLLNSLGQQVQTRKLALTANGTETKMDVSSLAAGIYTLQIKAGSQVATKQVVVQ